MMKLKARLALAAALVVVLIAGVVVALDGSDAVRRIYVTAQFANTNGLFPGDEVRILGVPVGAVDAITPNASNVTVRLWFDRRYKVPADVEAVIFAPAVVSARVVQLTPAYTGGPTLQGEAVISQDRTAVPVEWDELREQLQELSATLQPTAPGGLSPLGELINTGADNLRGQGANVRDSIIELSQALSALGDHSGDMFSTVKNLSTLVAALGSSSDVLAQLNRNLAGATNLMSNDPNEIGQMVTDLSVAAGDVQAFVAKNRESLGTTMDKLAPVVGAVVQSLGDLKQVLHVAPNTLANFTNIYYPTTGGFSGETMLPNFANPLQFICSAIQSASRLNYEESAKLCVQYMAPIFKNRQYNFPPIGTTAGLVSVPIPIPTLGPPLLLPIPPFLLPTLMINLLPIPVAVSGAMARPNELTYSEDWMRPDFNYKPASEQPRPDGVSVSAPLPLSAEAAVPAVGQADPAAGLPGMMVPSGG